MRVEGLEETRNAYTKAKEEEQRQEQGDQIDLQFSFPDSQTACHRFPAGATIAFVKMIIEQNHSVESAKQVLKLGEKTLIDPLSLRDYFPSGSEAKIDVQLK
mmetsp:Transcript_352/g.877  ORF Transcript_352/g.877 Transcript_352/m.877 type:complete len:102 (+) Transcript_352:194-499(+)|eukprot:CAMPEP_0202351338 /NCGR_PEP_ID=MMETSP1126-20121109/8025_1 /ASSEMBLY_ACC=CAM_ASM_000457 /TAXON_ID=3047 /ORGANISM="Dunaliella tertiolecta, Strain CCMP1320" /LENGTH=101 /DNA_ID=CAMNT_0048943439 /DNA_START=77 /DNA_END=382 /DNA_ORIENTATION=-